MADDFLFLTELLGLRVYDLKGRRLGLVKDAAIVPLIDPSRVDRFLVGGGWAWLSVRHDQIRSISLDGIYLKDEQLTPYHSDEYMLRLVRDLLDQQIIDGQGRKVVRVTDVTFRIRHEADGDVIDILDVDIGLRSMWRRLAQGVVPRRWIRRTQSIIPPHSIRWEHCSIIEADPQRRLRLNISNKILERMHPADLADIVEDLSPDDREAIFETIDSEVAAETLSEIEPDVQAGILESLETEKAADIVEEMSPHDAADVLAELQYSVRQLWPGHVALHVASRGGETFSIRRRYASFAQAAAFQAVLDRLQALSLINWARARTRIDVTVAPGAASYLVRGP